MKKLFKQIKKLTICGLFCLNLLPSDAWASWLIKFIPDPSVVPAEAEIDELETKAKAGDWTLKEQFAAAYLYETLYPESLNSGCKRLPYGHQCRMMAKRKWTGWESLKDIIDADVKNNRPVSITVQDSLLMDYASYLRMIIKPNDTAEDSDCREMIYYYKKAISSLKKPCAAEELLEMARLGICVPKRDRRFDEYIDVAKKCVRPTV